MLKPLAVHTLKRFAAARQGMAAVEFAFIAPVMITMFFGTVELAQALNARQNVTNVASAAADLVAQQTNISNAEMTNVMAALNSILYPFSSDTATIVISSVVDNGAGGGRVSWSDAQHGTPRAVNSVITDLPDGLIVSGSGTSVIMAEVTYHYASTSTQLLKLPVSMTNKFYARPRRSLVITRSAS
jgi:Flp pilus assembly protein TadG